jgi:hypothetical protein
VLEEAPLELNPVAFDEEKADDEEEDLARPEELDDDGKRLPLRLPPNDDDEAGFVIR